jgi:hypothetical protein
MNGLPSASVSLRDTATTLALERTRVAYERFLVALPLLLIAEVAVHRRLPHVLGNSGYACLESRGHTGEMMASRPFDLDQ